MGDTSIVLEEGDRQLMLLALAVLSLHTVHSDEPRGFHDFVALARAFLENYPPDVFTGESGDPGVVFVVALRRALEALDGHRDVKPDNVSEGDGALEPGVGRAGRSGR